MTWIKNIVLIFIFFLLLNGLVKSFFSYHEKYQFYLNFKNEYQKLKKRNIELKTDLLRKNDPAEIEKKARENLNLGKKDETVVILSYPTPTPTIITPSPQPNWKQWVDLYLH